ncbi:MAG: hypothetical protein M3022_13050 [Actinomycetota bacterium]|nr:hypothetical protein [Actinomycetota bacterium]
MRSTHCSDEYYGIQGTTWQSPPLLAKPSETRSLAGKHLLIYTQGGRSPTSRGTHHAVYWISNTLTTDISTDR